MYSTRAMAHQSYRQIMVTAKKEGSEAIRQAMRELVRKDLFYLLVKVMGRTDADRDWIYDRCKEVYEDPNGHLDVWAREHYKSTIITYALTIQDVLKNPEVKICIFSFVRPIAKDFLGQIKFELENNDILKWLFPEILWADPRNDAPKAGVPWNLEKGLVVKRQSKPKEATIETSGLVDGQKTGPHYDIRIYDDVITKEQVTNPEMIKKVTEAWEFSINLGTDGGVFRVVGTFYHLADTYRIMMDRNAVTPRIYPGTVDGKASGKAVLMSREWLEERRTAMGPYVFSSQILCDPKQEGSIGFREEWLEYWARIHWNNMNLIMVCDPAGSKNKTSDYTAIWVLGLGSDRNVYVLEMVRDRLSLTERGNRIFALHREYRPDSVYYEKYGLQADVEYFDDRMDRENYRFHITELGGRTAKADRIKALIPWFEQGRIFLPNRMMRRDYQGNESDLVQAFIKEEYNPFPFGAHDDMFDALARFTDEKVSLDWPEREFEGDELFTMHPKTEEYDPFAGL